MQSFIDIMQWVAIIMLTVTVLGLSKAVRNGNR